MKRDEFHYHWGDFTDVVILGQKQRVHYTVISGNISSTLIIPPTVGLFKFLFLFFFFLDSQMEALAYFSYNLMAYFTSCIEEKNHTWKKQFFSFLVSGRDCLLVRCDWPRLCCQCSAQQSCSSQQS